MVRSTLTVTGVLLFVVVLLTAAQATADVPPIDVCSTVDEPCRTQEGKRGICKPSTCSRLVYGGEPAATPTRDGEESAEPSNPGPRSVEYECNRCVVGAIAEPATDVPTPTATNTSTDSKVDSGGKCTAAGPGWGALLLALTFLQRRRHT